MVKTGKRNNGRNINMREIKFRAFLKSNKLMYDVLTLDIIDNKVLINNEEKQLRGYVKYQDVELMQYTGLKDKNGKEIYEGDIVLDAYTKQLLTVVFRDGEWRMENEDYDEVLYDVSIEKEVFGNVYEKLGKLRECEKWKC
jgi:hypothetical protein